MPLIGPGTISSISWSAYIGECGWELHISWEARLRVTRVQRGVFCLSRVTGLSVWR